MRYSHPCHTCTVKPHVKHRNPAKQTKPAHPPTPPYQTLSPQGGNLKAVDLPGYRVCSAGHPPAEPAPQPGVVAYKVQQVRIFGDSEALCGAGGHRAGLGEGNREGRLWGKDGRWGWWWFLWFGACLCEFGKDFLGCSAEEGLWKGGG